MEVQDTLVLSRADVAGVLEIGECIDAVELAFRERAEGRAMPPKMLGMHVSGGGFHIKAAAMHLGRYYFVVKSNGNFPGNMRINGLPTIQGCGDIV
ncbi:MAG: hypothetical protein HC859_12720 [Bacteroidia bacterium]|nr:hypothetical protein [Bacteroidia bacterium]